MLLTLNPQRFFFVSILFSGFLGYVFNSGLIAYGPLIFMAVLVVVYELFAGKRLNKTSFWLSMVWLPYVAWAGFVYVSNPLDGRYLTTHMLSILLLPLLTLSFCRLFESEKRCANYNFIYKSLLVFLLLQLIVCLGQLATFFLGVGLPVNELYAEHGMVTGTFFNSNDLAAVVLGVLFFVLGLEKYLFKRDRFVFWMIAFLLLVIAGSRSAIALAVVMFILYKANNPRKVAIYSILGVVISTIVVGLGARIDSDAIVRILNRLESLSSVMQHGVYSDSSMTMRLTSYLYFLGKLPELGFGSMEINNYFKYSVDASFLGKELLFQNPHSLVVELGYWLGWPGLIFFFTPLFFLLSRSRRKLLLVLIFMVASMIPSSILGNMLFFMILILCFFDYRSEGDLSKG